MLRLEGQRAILLGVLLVQAAQVGQLLDHLGVEEPPVGVVQPDVGLEGLRHAVLEVLHAGVVLDPRAVCGEGEREEGEQGALWFTVGRVGPL